MFMPLEDEQAARKREEWVDDDKGMGMIVLRDTTHQYRTFNMLTPYLTAPHTLAQQTIIPVSHDLHDALLNAYAHSGDFIGFTITSPTCLLTRVVLIYCLCIDSTRLTTASFSRSPVTSSHQSCGTDSTRWPRRSMSLCGPVSVRCVGRGHVGKYTVGVDLPV